MKRLISASMLCIVLIASASANAGIVSYLEGDVSIQKPGGSRLSAAIGDDVSVGDTIYTGADGFAELALGDASSITIEAGSAFNVGEIADPEVQGGKKGFFRVLLGAVAFKFRGLDSEPDIGSPLSVCSVRGTDFTVYTGPDGASLTVVSDGLVEVTSGAQSAMLSAGEGVEAVVGLGLGEPFEAKTGIIPYTDFIDEALTRIDTNPIDVLDALTDQMLVHASEGSFFLDSWNTNYEQVKIVRQEMNEKYRDEGPDEADRFEREALIPLQLRSLDLNRTYRHHFVSALHLRRHIYTSIYIRMRTRYLADQQNPEWQKFTEAYNVMLSVYENRLIPFLEDEDL